MSSPADHLQDEQRSVQTENFQVPNLKDAKQEDGLIKLSFVDGTTGVLAYEWLRDNCRCSECYDFIALSRAFNLDDLKDDLSPEKVWTQDGVLNITWNDLHQSVYEKEWIYIRGFISKGKEIYENFRHIQKKIWGGADSKLEGFEFDSVMKEDKTLFEFLRTVEEQGIALIKGAPSEKGTAGKVVEKIGHLRLTHFGNSRTVKVKEHHSYVAYSTLKLGLHTDLSYYEDSPGLIFVHAVKQHDGNGAESIVVDGFKCAKFMEENHPKEFELLSCKDAYNWDKFNPDFHSNENRFKMNKAPIFSVGADGEVHQVTFNNQKRDTNIEIDNSQIDDYYKALIIFLDYIYENIYTYKLKTGEIMALDNTRFLHGREAYEWPSDRQLDVAFMDWDEARSRRRLLQEKLCGVPIIFQ